MLDRRKTGNVKGGQLGELGEKLGELGDTSHQFPVALLLAFTYASPGEPEQC